MSGCYLSPGGIYHLESPKGKALHGSNRCWYFFAGRATGNGCWEADVSTGDDEVIVGGSGNKDVGAKKTQIIGFAPWCSSYWWCKLKLPAAPTAEGREGNRTSANGLYHESTTAAGPPATLHADGMSCRASKRSS